MSELTTFYFVRHGESEANAARRFAGQSDSPLTPRGRRQAETVAAELAKVKFDRIVSSDLSRTRETAEAIAKRQGVGVEVIRELREIDVGERTGTPFDEARGLPNWSDDGFVAWPGGETLDAVLARTLGAIDRLTRESPGKTILVVGHGGINRILLSHFLGILPKLDRSPATNTNISVVHTDGKAHTVERLFAADHVG
ncbi:MAG TPA: histidine phosphatase family protein [Candidatus Limnocylindria bacterium]|jgi:broad specificity phosphatase PhoE|nr:histidine phosphatase family protein [Candidatus Limnocylindria bacterium]